MLPNGTVDFNETDMNIRNDIFTARSILNETKNIKIT